MSPWSVQDENVPTKNARLYRQITVWGCWLAAVHTVTAFWADFIDLTYTTTQVNILTALTLTLYGLVPLSPIGDANVRSQIVVVGYCAATMNSLWAALMFGIAHLYRHVTPHMRSPSRSMPKAVSNSTSTTSLEYLANPREPWFRVFTYCSMMRGSTTHVTVSSWTNRAHPTEPTQLRTHRQAMITHRGALRMRRTHRRALITHRGALRMRRTHRRALVTRRGALRMHHRVLITHRAALRMRRTHRRALITHRAALRMPPD